MKIPLRFQITEFDCGSVSLINCISYLFDREEIPAKLLKTIFGLSLFAFAVNVNAEYRVVCPGV